MDDHELQVMIRTALDKEQASRPPALDARIDPDKGLADVYHRAGLDPALADQADHSSDVCR